MHVLKRKNKRINAAPNIHDVGIYHSKTKFTITQLHHALRSSSSPLNILEPTIQTVLLGDFNIYRMQASADQKALNNLQFSKGYTQLINQYTTDYFTQIDHVTQITIWLAQ